MTIAAPRPFRRNPVVMEERIIRMDNLDGIWNTNSKGYVIVTLILLGFILVLCLIPSPYLTDRIDGHHALTTKAHLLVATGAFLFFALHRTLLHVFGYTQITFVGDTLLIGDFSRIGEKFLMSRTQEVSREHLTSVSLERTGLALTAVNHRGQWRFAQGLPRGRAIELHQQIEAWMGAQTGSPGTAFPNPGLPMSTPAPLPYRNDVPGIREQTPSPLTRMLSVMLMVVMILLIVSLMVCKALLH